MAELRWYTAVDQIKPHVVRISTPGGSGTGFLLMNAQRTGLAAIATAAHVIDHAHYWEQPIRIQHSVSGKALVVREHNRAIFLHDDDTAAIVLSKEDLPLPDASLPMVDREKHLRVGNEIAWLGFPAIPGADLCFFGGRVSAWREGQAAYLVDGVAINGVSGGPAFYIGAENNVKIMGVVSAYAPNRATGEALPGLSVVRSVTKLHDVVQNLSSLDEAKEQETPPATIEPSPEPKQQVDAQPMGRV
jgi:hypothetical protein